VCSDVSKSRAVTILILAASVERVFCLLANGRCVINDRVRKLLIVCYHHWSSICISLSPVPCLRLLMIARASVCLYVCVVQGHFIGGIIRCYWNPDVAWLGHTWRETFQAQRCESSHPRTSVSAISCVCMCSVCHSCEIASAVAIFRKPPRYDVSSLIFFFLSFTVIVIVCV